MEDDINNSEKVISNINQIIEGKNEILNENPEKYKKRHIEEDFEPVLVRLPSDNPSCSSDYIYINKDQFKIGRKPDNDEVILSVWISRNHCIIQYDKNNDNWCVTNLSSTDTLLNEKPIERNKAEILKEGDILQLSLSDDFKYKFTLAKKVPRAVKYSRIESDNFELDNVLNKQKSFVEWQQNERKDLEKQLLAKQQEQEGLKQELEKLLQDQKVTKNYNEELNNQILQLQNKIEIGNSTELELQQKYRDLLEKLKEERLKFEEKLAEEKQKWQKILKEIKQEKEKLEMSMVEQMEEWREKLEKQQQETWQNKIDCLLQEEKSVQIKLQEEKQLLEQKLKEMETVLKEREKAQKQQNTLIVTAQPLNIKNCITVEIENSPTSQTTKIQQRKCPILDTIDLTNCDDNNANSKNVKEKKVIDKVNHIMDEQLTCSICSELFVRAMTLNCMHTFCRYCIDSWIKRRRECPNCRSSIVSMTRSLVVDNFIEKMLESLTPEQMQKRNELIEERKRLSIKTVQKKVAKKR